MTTDDVLREALYACADATDQIVPGAGKGYRDFADRKYSNEVVEMVTCPRCKGNGYAEILPPGMSINDPRGGEIENPCSECGGARVVEVEDEDE